MYLRLGCLFQDFKAKPATCAMYMAIKMWQRVTKGALLGVFYGTCRKSVVGYTASMHTMYVDGCRVAVIKCNVSSCSYY